MKYKVTHRFVDLQDENHVYSVGDEYPRAGKRVTQERINELASDRNRRHTVLIIPLEATGDSLSCADEVETGSCTQETKKRKKNTKKSKE